MTDSTETPLRSFGPNGDGADRARPQAPEKAEPRATLLDELRESITDSLPGGAVIDIPVPGRSKWAVRFRRDLEFPTFSRWLKKAKDKSQAGEVDALKLACTVIANQTAAILRVREGAELKDGRYADEDVELLADDDGAPLNFTSPAIHDMLDTGRSIDAVRKFYGLDGYAIQVSGDVLDANGLGDEVGSDPT